MSERTQSGPATAMPILGRYYLAAAALILLSALPTLLLYPQLPSVVPLQGDSNAFGPKWSLFLYTPGLMMGILLMFIAVPRILPVRRLQMNSSQPSYLYVMIVIVTLLSYSQILVLLSGLGWDVDQNWGMAGGICLLMLLLGNGLHKMRRTVKAARTT